MPRKVVVVTGANRGLGLELARHFLAAREDDRTWEVFACSRSEDPVGAIAEGGGGERVRWVKLDVRVPETVDALGRAFATHDVSEVHALINNAGVCIGRECALGGVDYDAWTRSFEVNVMGATRVLEAVLPRLARDAVVVNVSGRMGSIARAAGGLGASSATTQDVVYRTTKAALNMMTVCAAAELRGREETEDAIVIAVDPGWMRTDMGTRGGAVPDAPLDPKESAAGIVALIDRLKPEDTGKFLSWQGETMPW